MSKLADVVPGAVNAIVKHVEAGAQLPAHDVFKHAEPKAVTPERAPLLACWLGPSRWELIATPATYDLKPRIFVAWYDSASESAQSDGAGDDELVSDLVGVADAIAVRLEQLAEGLPGMAHLYGVLVQTTVTSTDGTVWKAMHELELEWL